MPLMKKDTNIINLKNFTQSIKAIPTSQEIERQKKIEENEAYIEHIKEHDKEAYQRYLSYSTYLKH